MKESAIGRPRPGNSVIVILIACLLALIAPAETAGSNPQARTSALPEPQITTQQSKPAEVRELRPGSPVERELAAGEVHSYRITLSSDQYVHITAEQLGVNVEVALFDPAGGQIAS